MSNDSTQIRNEILALVKEYHKTKFTKKQKINIGKFIVEQLDDDAQIALLFKLKESNQQLTKDLVDTLPKTEPSLALFTSPEFIKKVFLVAANKG